MENPVGLRFLPTDEEIVDHYLRLKNHGGSTATHVDQVISTLDICNFDPCELPAQSRMASSDQVWYFFCRKQRRYNRGERQKRQTKSGFWKKTGTTLSIKRKSGDREKIGEKNVLVFCKNESKLSKKEKEKEKEKKGSKSNWVMHEYHHTSSFVSHQSVTYTICKVQRKDDASEISSSGTVMVEHSHSLVTPVNNPGGGLCMGPEIPRQLSGVFDKHQEMNLEEIQMAFDNLPSYINWENLLADDGDHEQIKTA